MKLKHKIEEAGAAGYILLWAGNSYFHLASNFPGARVYIALCAV